MKGQCARRQHIVTRDNVTKLIGHTPTSRNALEGKVKCIYMYIMRCGKKNSCRCRVAGISRHPRAGFSGENLHHDHVACAFMIISVSPHMHMQRLLHHHSMTSVLVISRALSCSRIEDQRRVLSWQRHGELVLTSCSRVKPWQSISSGKLKLIILSKMTLDAFIH